MNGRVYDYNLGRFMSVDPFIQEPGNSQSINPYSYIMNNPLAGTDPTGYVAKMEDQDWISSMDMLNIKDRFIDQVALGGSQENANSHANSSGVSGVNAKSNTQSGIMDINSQQSVASAEMSINHNTMEIDQYYTDSGMMAFSYQKLPDSSVIKGSSKSSVSDLLAPVNVGVGIAGIAAGLAEVAKVDMLRPKGNVIMHSKPTLNSVNLGTAAVGTKPLLEIQKYGKALGAPLAALGAGIAVAQSVEGIRTAQTATARQSHIIKGAMDLTVIAGSLVAGGPIGVIGALAYLSLDYVFDFRGKIEAHLVNARKQRKIMNRRLRQKATGKNDQSD